MTERWLWAYALLGSALAWTAHILVTYAVGESACIIEGTAFRLLGLTASAWGLIVFSLVCLAISIGSVIMAVRLRGARNGVIPYMGEFGIFSGVLFTVAILAQAAPIFFLSSGC